MSLFDVLVSIAACSGMWALIALRGPLRQTSLTSAWCLGLLAGGWGMLAWLETVMSTQLDDIARQHVWYFAAVLGCCPWVAVLGARQPTASVWTWFVVTPLVLVLEWPVLAQLIRGGRQLDVHWPVATGFGVVLVMGVGNFFATRVALGSLLMGTAVIAALASLGEPTMMGWKPHTWRQLCVIAATLGIHHLRLQLARTENSEGFERVWEDFRDRFGIVWARRVMDRVNHAAELERWSCRLQLHGIEWLSAETATGPNGHRLTKQSELLNRTDSLRHLRHTLTWLLKRFVEPSWLESRWGPVEFAGSGESDAVIQPENGPARDDRANAARGAEQ